LSKIKDKGQRSAALLMLIGQTMLSSGVMVGGALAERAHQQRAEAKVGTGLADERPPGTADSAKTTAPGTPSATMPTGPTDAMFEKARVDADMSRLGKMDAESEKRLRANEPLRTALVDQPLAAGVLKKCASNCFPPEVTPPQIERLDRLLSRLAETGGYDEAALRKYLYDRRKELDKAIDQIQGVENGAHLNLYLEYFNKGRTIKELPAPRDPKLLLELRDRAHDYGVDRGRTQAQSEGMTSVGFKNPFERRGRYGQGFDDVMKKGANADVGEVYIVEYKGGDAVLAKGQMELDWIIGNIRKLYLEGGPAGEAMARALAKALREGRLRGVVYSTPVINGVPQPTVTVKAWSYPVTPLFL
ncbi:MAG: hypothetical protein ACRD1H_04955, partial [Vicinamibacterales bacterium]